MKKINFSNKLNKRLVISIITCLMLLSGLSILPTASAANPVYVDDDFNSSTPGWGVDHFTSIQAGINAVDVGGIVNVAAGNYQENLASWKDMEIIKSLSLIGAGSGSTVVELSQGKMNGVEIRGTNLAVHIEGITFTRRLGNTYAAGFNLRIAETASTFTTLSLIDVEVAFANGPNVNLGTNGAYNQVIIEDCNFHHAGTWGLYSQGQIPNGMQVTNSHFDYNGVVDPGHGIGFDLSSNSGSSNIMVTGSTFNHNAAKGINLLKTSSATFDDIEANYNQFGVSLWEWSSSSSDLTFTDSEFSNNDLDGFLFGTEGTTTIDNVEITQCDIYDNARYGVYFYHDFGGTVSNIDINYNNIVGNGGGIGTSALGSTIIDGTCNWWGDIYGPSGEGPGSGDSVGTNVEYCPWLDGSYPGGSCVGGVAYNIDKDTWFCCIQCAIDDADPCNRIEVIPGTHVEQLLITKNLTLQGLPGAIIQATTTMTAYTIPESTSTFYPIIFADGGSDIISVEVDGFEIDGVDNPNSYERHVGILYRNIQPGCRPSRIAHNEIYGMGTNGQQTFGILVYGDSDVLIEYNDNTVSEFSRGGIGALGDGGSAPDPVVVIDHNTVVGPYDPMGSPTWASNGIQVSYGASGSITNNDVSACGWPGTAWAGTGILVGDTSNVVIDGNYVHDCEQAVGVGDYPASWGPPFNAATASDIDVTYNIIDNNEWGISVFNNITNVLIKCNKITNSLYDGVDVYNYGYGDNSPTIIEIHCNEIVGSGADGLWVGPLVTQIVDAECNWWGDHSGPGGDGPGFGDTVIGNADYDPWISVNADANGPYIVEDTHIINFDGSATQTTGCCGAVVTYLWDFDDGQVSGLINPTHTYSRYGTYTVTLTVTITNDCGFTYSDTDTTTAYCFRDPSKEPPTVALIYPEGGETLKDTVTVQWFVHDTQDEWDYDVPIYLFYSDESNNWYQINGVFYNTDDVEFTGEYLWDTTSLPDGTYELLLEAVDSDGNVGHDQSKPFQIKNHDEPPENHAPNKPSKPIGPAKGKAGEEYTFASSTTDSDGDKVWYLFEWGDGANSGWLGPFNSGETCEAKHTWEEQDGYQIRVKAKDKQGEESPWSDPLGVSMPVSKHINNPLFRQILNRLLERYPAFARLLSMFPIFNELLNN